MYIYHKYSLRFRQYQILIWGFDTARRTGSIFKSLWYLTRDVYHFLSQVERLRSAHGTPCSANICVILPGIPLPRLHLHDILEYLFYRMSKHGGWSLVMRDTKHLYSVPTIDLSRWDCGYIMGRYGRSIERYTGWRRSLILTGCACCHWLYWIRSCTIDMQLLRKYVL